MRTARLYYSAPETDADLFHVGRFSAPDPFLALEIEDGERIAVLPALEFARAKASSRFDRIFDLEELNERIGTPSKRGPAAVVERVRYLLREFGLDTLRVSPRFPVGVYTELQAQNVRVSIGEEPFLPERVRKSLDEVAALREANRIAAKGLARAEAILRESTIVSDTLIYDGGVLTSERLRCEIEIACLREGGRADHTIAASARQACDPHEVGHGPVRPHELIIVDVFPRSTQSKYFGDMTRTFLKGTPRPEQVALHDCVLDVQQRMLGRLKAGNNGREIREECLSIFENRGYPTRRTTDGHEGFFHGLGHGLGLEIHESPSMGREDVILEPDSVVTVEPGLYYPGLGGCRIEDVVVLHHDHAEKISDYPYEWILE